MALQYTKIGISCFQSYPIRLGRSSGLDTMKQRARSPYSKYLCLAYALAFLHSKVFPFQVNLTFNMIFITQATSASLLDYFPLFPVCEVLSCSNVVVFYIQ